MDNRHASIYYVGTTAERTALSLSATAYGVRFYDTNIGSEFVWDGTKWLVTGGVDEITATDAGVAASVETLNTEVTTNGDSDLDNVTLANGYSGQVKHIYCVVEGNVGDTWKITPTNMVGGTQITFAGVGEGCSLVYADNEGWIVVGNNGGTIT